MEAFKNTDNTTKLKEGRILHSAFEAAQRKDKSLTVESLAHEIGVTQGLVSQWFTGKTNIPDKRMIWLGGRLDFDPLKVRPELKEYFYTPYHEGGRARRVAALSKDLLTISDEDYYRLEAMILAYITTTPPP